MKYDPTHPIVYFDIGEAIAVLAIIVAFMTLLKPITQFRLQVYGVHIKTAFLFFVPSFFFVLYSAVLPLFTDLSFWIFRYPIFWEVISGVLILIVSMELLIYGNKNPKFSNNNYKRYFDECTKLISCGDIYDLKALADDIRRSSESIIQFCKQYNSEAARDCERNNKKYQIDEPVKFALDLLDLFSDATFCKVIVTSSPSTAISFIKEIQDQRLYNSGGYFFVNQLIKQAFLNESSIFHREVEYYGFGNFLPFTITVFGDYKFVDSHFRPLQACSFLEDEFKTLRIQKKYIKAFKTSLKAYLSSMKHASPSAIISGMKILSGFSSDIAVKLNHEKIEYHETSGSRDSLYSLIRSYTDILHIISKFHEELPHYDFDPVKYDINRDDSIYGIVAKGVYDFLINVSIVDKHDWFIRNEVMCLWMKLYPESDDENINSLKEIQKRIEVCFESQVLMNLEEDSLCYPMITRLLINILGLYSRDDSSHSDIRLREKLHSLLKSRIKNVYNRFPKRINELLPNGVLYDSTNNKIVQKLMYAEPIYELKCD